MHAARKTTTPSTRAQIISQRNRGISICAAFLAVSALGAQVPPSSGSTGTQQVVQPVIQTDQKQATKPGKAPAFATPPVAIVALDPSVPGAALSVAGSMQAWNGRAFITGSGSITAGAQTAAVSLPYRGTLRVCASTTVNLVADKSAPPNALSSGSGAPALLMALDHGAVELSFANTPHEDTPDTLMTPDFRILISGSGPSEIKVRLAGQGDTCIDNGERDDRSSAQGVKNGTPSDRPAAMITNAATSVVVTSLFDSGTYRVLAGQRVMFQHGSLREVVDQEKEPCGCPPAPSQTAGNEFPLAQSEGLVPLPPTPAHKDSDQVAAPAQVGNVVPPLVYPQKPEQQPPAIAPTAPQPTASTNTAAPENKKPSMFTRLGHFFRRIFGAE